jgi:FkbM family methyltransferase
MGWEVAFRGSYDAALQGALIPHVRPGSLVFDVGASLGLWTVPLGRAAVERGASVWAFEPHPNNHPWLHRNLDLNGLQNVATVMTVALGNQPGVVRMNMGEAHERGAGNAAISIGGTSDGAKVPVRRLDDISRPSPVSAMKVDVEGYELEVLRGAERLLREDRPVVLGEFGPEWLAARQEDLPAYLSTLSEIDYEALEVVTGRSSPWRGIDTVELRPLRLDRAKQASGLLLRPR